ncbi:COG3650 family protein [Pseudooctadecabacter jejudonensis]|nr:SH3 domain-containing protein [Pseudooctadecabacter jejudonensis]
MWATTGAAQTLPERFSVTGVAEDDVLNIRNGPGASFDKTGELEPFTLNVEVLDQQDGWALIPTSESTGWVSMRFLRPNPIPANEIPRPLVCSGTEPFWDIGFYPRGADYTELGLERRDLTVIHEETAPDGYLVEAREGPTMTRTLIVKAGVCSDGMSDRQYGMSALLFTSAPDGNFVHKGCCTIQ